MSARAPAAAPHFTVGVPAHAAEPDLARTLRSLRHSAEHTGLPYEMVVAVNGPHEPASAVAELQAFAAAAGLAVSAGASAAEGGAIRLLRLAPQSKVAAWNAIRAVARAPVVIFADADVEVDPGALARLLGRLAAEPARVAVAGRESPVVAANDGLVARVAALPYRFDFGNVPGRLYALRASAWHEPMPEGVVAEDAYLTVTLGPARFVKEPAAVVYFRPPLTWRDYLRQRVRHEVGKLQLAREYPESLRAHGFGRYPWRAFVREIAAREYPLAAIALAIRLGARLVAHARAAGGVRAGWGLLPSTKRWTAGGAAGAGGPGAGTAAAGGATGVSAEHAPGSVRGWRRGHAES